MKFFALIVLVLAMFAALAQVRKGRLGVLVIFLSEVTRGLLAGVGREVTRAAALEYLASSALLVPLSLSLPLSRSFFFQL